MSDIALFTWAVLAHWQSLVTGGVAVAIITIVERRNNKPISWRNIGVLLVAGVLVSAFYAWRDEHRNSQVLINQKADLWGKFNSCQMDGRVEQSKVGFLETNKRELQQRVEEDITTIAKSQTAISNLGIQLGKLAVLEPPRVSIKSTPLPRIGTPDRTVWVTIALTNKTRMPVKGIITCEHGFGADPWGGIAGWLEYGAEEELFRPINAKQIDATLDARNAAGHRGVGAFFSGARQV